MNYIYTYRELCVLYGEPTVRRTIAAWYRLTLDFSFDEALEQVRMHRGGAYVPSQHGFQQAVANRRYFMR